MKKDSLIKKREASLKKNLKKEKNKSLKKEKMPVLSDKWIKKTVQSKGMIKPFIDKQIRKGKNFIWSLILWI